MASDRAAALELLGSGRYSACDISDALQVLKVPQAGFLPDIRSSSFVENAMVKVSRNVVPIPMRRQAALKPLVAPLSTITFIPKAGPGAKDPQESNIPAGKHFTDMPAPGTIALIQQPAGLLTAVLGDIMATRLHLRGIRGVVIDGRCRDIGPIGGFCADRSTPSVDGSEANFSVWSRATSTVSPSLQCRAWCADVPVTIGDLTITNGDLLFADETERGVVVIPHDKVDELVGMLPAYKDTDDLRVADVEAGYSIVETTQRHP